MAKRGGFPGGMPGNMNNLMKQAQKMQKQMETQQAELDTEVQGRQADGHSQQFLYNLLSNPLMEASIAFRCAPLRFRHKQQEHQI